VVVLGAVGWLLATPGATATANVTLKKEQTVVVASNFDRTSGVPLRVPGTFDTRACARVSSFIDTPATPGVVHVEAYAGGLAGQVADIDVGDLNSTFNAGQPAGGLAVPSLRFTVRGDASAPHVDHLYLFCGAQRA
jgi:hypothetical protein